MKRFFTYINKCMEQIKDTSMSVFERINASIVFKTYIFKSYLRTPV